jgi:CRISPR-associated endonuclease/helicase Cas3
MIFAKSREIDASLPLSEIEKENITLLKHTLNVTRAAEAILSVISNQIIKNCNLNISSSIFKKIVLLSCLIHDFGKANNHFQNFITSRQQQFIRHEHLTLILFSPKKDNNQLYGYLREILLELVNFHEDKIINEEYINIAILAAFSHHLKTGRDFNYDVDSTVTFLGSDIQMYYLFCEIASLFGTKDKLSIVPRVNVTHKFRFEKMNIETELFYQKTSQENKKILPLVKGIVICADVIGSSLYLTKEERSDENNSRNDKRNIINMLNTRASSEDFNEIMESRLNGNKLRPFQQKVADSHSKITYIKAGCGTGKTLAAYAWAQKYASRQVWVTYPTTGTSTEGFRDYVNFEDFGSQLITSRANIDYELFQLHSNEPEEKDDIFDVLRDLKSKFIIATVDSLLSIMQNNRKALMRLPAIQNSVVVFDEVHSYDDQMFSHLLNFIKTFPGIPCLIMTASLPLHRELALTTLVKELHGEDLIPLEGPQEIEDVKRYELVSSGDYKSDISQVDEIIRKTINERGKILRICNTVNTAVEDYLSYKDNYDCKIYHSRFKYLDRVAKHKDLISSFREDRSIMAFTTQVAEMSLDLSSDLLITDLANVPALIQRFGRVNRKNPITCLKQIVILQPETFRPYENIKTIQSKKAGEALQWLEKLAGIEGGFSQSDLVKCWDHSNTDDVDYVKSNFNINDFHTIPGAFRDIEASYPVILKADYQRYKRSVDIQGRIIPMNRHYHLNLEKCHREKFGYVMDEKFIEYSSEIGGRWLYNKK